MIVSAARHYFEDIKVFGNAQPGDCFEIDSGLGGSWQIRFIEKTGTDYKFFQPAHFDFPERFLTFTPSNVLSKVFICVPESKCFREWKTVMIQLNGQRFAIDKDYGIVWVEDPAGYLKLFGTIWKDADLRDSKAVRSETRINRKKH